MMATDIALASFAQNLQRWMEIWHSMQPHSLASAGEILRGEAADLQPVLGDAVGVAVDGGTGQVGVPERVGDAALAAEFGTESTPSQPFLGAAAARRLDDVGEVLASGWLSAWRQSLQGRS
jgi:hypothetical protein